jgi:protein-tyrosine kinase
MDNNFTAADRASDKPSLLERATGVYDFGEALRGRAAPALDTRDLPPPPVHAAEDVPFVARAWTGPVQALDRAALGEAGFILPDGPVSAISEEFRIVKRQLLGGVQADDPATRRMLLCSAQPGEGKTFCAVNLALSLAAEKDVDVLLVDADFANPSVLTALGLESGPGFMDALADPAIAVEDCVIRTDIPSLAVLPAGRPTNNDTEFLASARTEPLLDRLMAGNPNRIILFDSPPLLAASLASVLASHVGQALLVVRADVTSETTLRDAASLLKECPKVQLLLNGVKFSASGRRFGAYYGKEQ